MKGKQAILGQINGHDVAARVVDGVLDDLVVLDPNSHAPGTILRGVIDRPMKGMGGAMLRLPSERRPSERLPSETGFLRKANGLAAGQTITVQVTGYAEPGKATPLTDRPLFKSRYAIVTPHAPGLNISRSIRDEDIRDDLTVIAKETMQGSDMGLILRSACDGADPEAIEQDIAHMRDMATQIMADDTPEPTVLLDGDTAHQLAWREWADISDVRHDLEDSDVPDLIAAALSAYTPLAGGGMYMEPTRALTAVDVNTGGDTSPQAALKANLAAIAALPRVLRIKGLGGQIVIDLAPLSKRDRKTVETALRKSLRNCPVATEFVGWTPLGHIELKRKRERCETAPLLAKALL